MNLEKFTERSRGMIQSAQTIAMREDHQRFTPQHLLKALLDDGEGFAANLIKVAGGDPTQIVQNLDANLAKMPKVSGVDGQIYIDGQTAKIISKAENLAQKAGDSYVPVERMLMALVIVKSDAATILKSGSISA